MIIIALGSNLAWHGFHPAEILGRALYALEEKEIKICIVSRLWLSAPWPSALADSGQGCYRNAVALIETDVSAQALLQRLHDVEASFGRTRRERWAARSLDLDLIDYHGRVEEGALQLPHPRIIERLFVLKPLAEVAPAWRHPVFGAIAPIITRLEASGQEIRLAGETEQMAFRDSI